MIIEIDYKLCNQCNEYNTPLCVSICPGNLLYKDTKNNKIKIRNIKECWGCGACVKECSNQAIKLILPSKLGSQSSFLKAKETKDSIVWELFRKNDKIENYKIKVFSDY